MHLIKSEKAIDMSIDIVEIVNGTKAAAQSKDKLGTLPDELLLRLFDTLGHISKKDLCSVSRLNKRYHRLGDAVLYKSLLLDTPELHLTFSESLGRRPRRGSAIYEVKLAYPSTELSNLHLDAPLRKHNDPSHSLSRMTNLEKLDISLPDILLHGIGSLFNGPFDLAYLKSCTLFYQCANDQYWDLRENIHIFTLSTLESLTIKRARLDERGFDFLERPHPTDLKKLYLIDCDINDDGLSDILEFPTALEEFVMTQADEPEPDLVESSDTFSDYMAALDYQAHSLRSITVNSPTLSSRKVLRMRHFESLKVLRMNWDYQLFGKSTKKPRLHSVGLPPNLELLEFFNELGTDEGVTDLLLSLVQSKKAVADRWKSIVVVESDKTVIKNLREACMEQDLQLDVIGALDTDTDTE